MLTTRSAGVVRGGGLVVAVGLAFWGAVDAAMAQPANVPRGPLLGAASFARGDSLTGGLASTETGQVATLAELRLGAAAVDALHGGSPQSVRLAPSAAPWMPTTHLAARAAPLTPAETLHRTASISPKLTPAASRPQSVRSWVMGAAGETTPTAWDQVPGIAAWSTLVNPSLVGSQPGSLAAAPTLHSGLAPTVDSPSTRLPAWSPPSWGTPNVVGSMQRLPPGR